MCKISNGLSPILIHELFMPNNEHTYSLRHLRQFKKVSVNISTESVSFLVSKVWEVLPDSYKKIDNIDTLKRQLKHGNLVIALADFVGSMFKTLVFSDLS